MAITDASPRGNWNSKLGFILAAAGSAVGLGNIWRFPYVTGQSGGAAFVIIYLICIAVICLPYLYAELVLGRYSKKNPVGAIEAVKSNTPWTLVGGLCVLTGMIILSYYGVIAGWAFGYIFKDIFSPEMEFTRFIATPELVIPLFILFIALTMGIVTGGVADGIERWAKILMPLLIILMIVVIIRSVTLPGAGEGLKFYLNPDFSKVSGSTVLAALGQAFFSLSLGMGAMITYGSYLSKKEDLISAGGYVAIFDTAIALMAGLMIFPAVFALGLSPDQGPALIFEILPKMFHQMPLGFIIGIVFFILLSIAALTSTISLLEVVVSYFIDEKNWTRKKSVWIVGTITCLVGIPSVLSQGIAGPLSDMTWLLGENWAFSSTDFLSFMDFIWGNISLALGALLISIFVGWVWGTKNAEEELAQGSTLGSTVLRFWSIFLKYVCPIVIFIVLLNIFGVFS